MSLLDEKDQTDSPTAKILETESYEHAFGPKQQRKKPRNVNASSLEELAQITDQDSQKYDEKQELDSTLGLMGGSFLDNDDFTQAAKEAIFHKGQSKRIWNELYKVIDSSDVVIHVLDARDPEGTRGVVRVEHVSNPEQYIADMLTKCERKHLERTYEVKGWSKFEEDPELLEKASLEFIELIARRQGRLLKGGEPDESGVSKQILNDFNRGKIPWFTAPPKDEEERTGEDKKAGYKRKRAEKAEREIAKKQKIEDKINAEYAKEEEEINGQVDENEKEDKQDKN
ncbi:hypothetical protein QCA50_017465 [Cerrena zonata]|uniref:Nucleolar GTP-binding protein 2 n=1 Tax=Cerrena zonata TaxID=2478898 RepID=A0AAW0FJQ1_9APHY